MSIMNTKSQSGELNVLLLPLIIAAVLFFGASGFAFWAYGERQDYKDNVDAKISEAVATETIRVKAEDQKAFEEAEKNPLKKYIGPEAFRAVTVEYPKTWSAYVDGSSNATPVDVYYHPNVVPSTQGNQTAYALRVQVESRGYDRVVATYQGDIKNGKVKTVPYTLPKVPGVTGLRLNGEIQSRKQGSMVILPLNDKTLKIWTESPDFVKDLETYILPNASFNP